MYQSLMFRQSYLATLGREQRLRTELERMQQAQALALAEENHLPAEEANDVRSTGSLIPLQEQVDAESTQSEILTWHGFEFDLPLDNRHETPTFRLYFLDGGTREHDISDANVQGGLDGGTQTPRSEPPRTLEKLVHQAAPHEVVFLENWADHGCPLVSPLEWMNRDPTPNITAQSLTSTNHEEPAVNPADLVLQPPALELSTPTTNDAPARVETIAELEAICENFPENLWSELDQEAQTRRPA